MAFPITSHFRFIFIDTEICNYIAFSYQVFNIRNSWFKQHKSEYSHYQYGLDPDHYEIRLAIFIFLPIHTAKPPEIIDSNIKADPICGQEKAVKFSMIFLPSKGG